MIKLLTLIKELFDLEEVMEKLHQLPKGTMFDDAKNIEGIFSKSKHSWSQVVEAYEKHKELQQRVTVNIQDIAITQPNVQANKVKKMLGKLDTLPPIDVVEFEDGEKAIYDGHHRLVVNWVLGRDKIEVNLVKLNNLQETINESVVNDVFLQILKIIGAAVASGLVAGLAHILRAIGGYVVDVLLNGISNYAKSVKNLVSPDTFTQFTTELSKNAQFNKQFLNILIKHGGLKNTNLIAFLNDIENTKEFNDILYKYYPKEKKFSTNERNQAVREFRNGIGNTLKDRGGWLVKTIKKKFPELKGVQVESGLSEILNK